MQEATHGSKRKGSKAALPNLINVAKWLYRPIPGAQPGMDLPVLSPHTHTCGMIPSSAATTKTTMSVTAAPRARIAENAL